MYDGHDDCNDQWDVFVGLVLGVIFGIVLFGNLFLTAMIGTVVGSWFFIWNPNKLNGNVGWITVRYYGWIDGSYVWKMIGLEYHDAVVKVR